jgi:tRNA (adenine57-N1/adenine58-N1)-methyltransferase
MYETLQRQHDLAVYQMPTLTDAIDKLKDIETRKKARRESQRQKALEEKAELTKKRKADEMESAADSEGAAATDLKTEETTETSTNGEALASELNAQQVGDSLPPSEVQSSTEEKAGTDAQTATKQQGSMNGQAKGSRTPSKKLVQEEKRYMNAKPAPQTRGHTSYLTFAFLMPESAEAVVVPAPEATSA